LKHSLRALPVLEKASKEIPPAVPAHTITQLAQLNVLSRQPSRCADSKSREDAASAAAGRNKKGERLGAPQKTDP